MAYTKLRTGSARINWNQIAPDGMFYTGRLKNGADLVMGVCDFVRCGPITLVQSGCV